MKPTRKAATVKARYRLEPRNVSDVVWYYETKRGLEFVVEDRNRDGELVHRSEFIVPWRLVAPSVDRHRGLFAPRRASRGRR